MKPSTSLMTSSSSSSSSLSHAWTTLYAVTVCSFIAVVQSSLGHYVGSLGWLGLAVMMIWDYKGELLTQEVLALAREGNEGWGKALDANAELMRANDELTKALVAKRDGRPDASEGEDAS